jgi:phospholipid/cholesterol/gamma-HCH transport system permease protein
MKNETLMAEEVVIPGWKKWLEGIGDQVGFFFKF